MRFKYGADPELFVRKKGTGEFVSAYGMVDGTKAKPIPVKDGAIQVDGMALEFNVRPCINMGDTFYRRIKNVMKELEARIPNDCELHITPVAEFGHDYIRSQPFEARRLGCEPDYNAWTGKVNKQPDASGSFRTAAGHIHIGWWDKPIRDKDRAFIMAAEVAKQLDYLVGLASVILDQSEDSKLRRSLYGRAGAFRPKPYGMEYRTPSNFWIKDYATFSIISRLTMLATQLLNTGVFLPQENDTMLEPVWFVINQGNSLKALWMFEQVCQKHNLLSEADLDYFRARV